MARLRPRSDSRGMRATEKLLTYFGPPQVGDVTAPHRPVTAEEQERDTVLRTEFVRVVGPDGHAYVVERSVTAPTAGGTGGDE